MQSGDPAFGAGSNTPVYVEGVTGSSKNSITLNWTKSQTPGDDDCDPGKMTGDKVAMTVVKSNILLDSGVAKSLPDADEFTKGAVVQLNDDDDDSDGILDNADSNGVTGENNLHKIHISEVHPSDVGGFFRLIIDDKLKVWTTSNKAAGSEMKSGVTKLDTKADFYYVEGVTASSGLAQEKIQLQWKKDDNGKVEKIGGLDKVAYTVAELDMDAHTVANNVANGLLEDKIEVSQGAYLPWNSDRDAYDADSKDYQLNKQPIPTENDLLPVTILQIAPSTLGGKYKLTIPSSFHVWKNPDKTEQVSTGDLLDPEGDDLKIWVEGMSGKKTGILKVDWENENQKIKNVDEVKLRTFEWKGPLNVPGHTKYSYEAEGGASGNASPWISAVDQKLTSIDDGSLDTASVLWDGGATVGGTVYRAAKDYTWKLDVNIVKIELDKLGLTVGNNDSGIGNVCGVLSTKSGLTAPAMATTADVTITGPTVDGVHRGVKYMETGLLQVTTNRADYKIQAESGKAVGYIIHYARTNQRILDAITRDCDGDVNKEWPWYDGTGKAGVGFFKGSNEIGTVGKTFKVVDTPSVGLPTVNFKANGKIWTPKRVDIHWDFEMNVGARTFDPGVVPAERDNFTRLATGNWAWDGGAKVKAGAWVADNPIVTRQQKLTVVSSGQLITWDLKNLPHNDQYFNKYLYPWLVPGNGAWVPYSQHKLQ